MVLLPKFKDHDILFNFFVFKQIIIDCNKLFLMGTDLEREIKRKIILLFGHGTRSVCSLEIIV